MSLPSHHPGDTLLIDYSGGALCEGASLVVATHLAFCPCCRRLVTDMEAVGGALLEDLEPEPVDCGCLDALLARIDREENTLPPCRPAARPASITASPPVAEPANGACRRLPEPLRGYLCGSLDQQPWRFLQPGMSCVDLDAGRSATTRLIRMKGGISVPRHTHGGIELTVVLEGGFSDEFGAFRPGDIAVGDPSIEHRPVSDREGCLCVTATVGGLTLTGPLGRFLNRFIRF
jgi:putative transcriptional regulator